MRPCPDSKEVRSAISVERMRQSDAYTIAHFVSGRELMYRAAQGVYHAASWAQKAVAIAVGGGNNGGDGYALAGILADHGVLPHIYQASDKCSADGAYYRGKAAEKGVPIYDFSGEGCFDGYDVVVDCLLGTGFSGVPRGPVAQAIRAINGSGAYVISVDINSGLNGDTGQAELAVRSDLTVSIGFYKTGHFLGRGPELIGDLVNADIGIVLCPEEK